MIPETTMTEQNVKREETLLLRTLYGQNQTFGFQFLKTLISDTKIWILKYFGNKHNVSVSNFKNQYEGTKVSLSS